MNNLILLSAERYDLNKAENADRTRWLALSLLSTGLRFEQVVGCYNDTDETSFAVRRSAKAYSVVFMLASLFDQESVLEIGEFGSARLFCPLSGRLLANLGHVVETNNPLAHASWTLYQGRFYTTKEVYL